ncbi:SHOCT domain-containing protein [Tropicimonas sp. IMCC6043]|uniref:SHOCT domain-containing protein n=1 Tax=Tropicimonas sp. IMCC6043 TaxID=2510645 RepID=UPI00101E1606|nr:SHOCT domain-containing protein [Tropicimonas sp. IMCC6043]RYH07299.1 SHOCT domain-containing protein [Tropicimonas sp. IMCC6043]
MPILHIFWSIFLIFLLVAWIWTLISVVSDIFASEDLSGMGKGLWMLGVIVVPWLGVLLYLVLRGDSMAARAKKAAEEIQAAQKAYIRDAAGTVSTADELAKLADLRDKGVISEEEFSAQKAKLLA